MTIVRRYDKVFTTAGYPKYTPDYQVGGELHRWSASSLSAVQGVNLESWDPVTGNVPLTQTVTNKRPAVYDLTDGRKTVLFDGVADELTAAGVESFGSLTVVLRDMGALPAGIFSAGSIGARQTTTEQMSYQTAGGSTTMAYPPGTSTGGFDTVTLGTDGALLTGALNGTFGTFAPGTDRFFGQPYIGRYGSSYGSINILEILIHDHMLTAQECATLHGNVQSQWGDIAN